MNDLLPTPPEPAEVVHVRQRQYLVEDVQQPPAPGAATLVTLSCLDVDAQREPLETEATHERNIEAGVLLDDPLLARSLRWQFESLIDTRSVHRLTRGLG